MRGKYILLLLIFFLTPNSHGDIIDDGMNNRFSEQQRDASKQGASFISCIIDHMKFIKTHMPFVATCLGLVACAFNSISGTIGMENIYLTVLAMLAFEAAR